MMKEVAKPKESLFVTFTIITLYIFKTQYVYDRNMTLDIDIYEMRENYVFLDALASLAFKLSVSE